LLADRCAASVWLGVLPLGLPLSNQESYKRHGRNAGRLQRIRGKREKEMFVLMILLWVLIRMSAPTWCYILLALSALGKILKGFYEVSKDEEN
jgi:hypothetical protein